MAVTRPPSLAFLPGKALLAPQGLPTRPSPAPSIPARATVPSSGPLGVAGTQHNTPHLAVHPRSRDPFPHSVHPDHSCPLGGGTVTCPLTQMALRAWAPAPQRSQGRALGGEPAAPAPAHPALCAPSLTSTQTAVLLMRQLRTSESMPLSTSSDSRCLYPSKLRMHSLQGGYSRGVGKASQPLPCTAALRACTPRAHPLTSLGLSLLARGVWSGCRWSTYFSLFFLKRDQNEGHS